MDVNRDAAEETAGIIQGEGAAASAFACDVTDSSGVRDVVEQVVARHGRFDILHNNVGYATMSGPIELDEAA